MNRNQEEGVWQDMPRDGQEGFQLSENGKTIMLVLLIFSVILFFTQYKTVYGTPSETQDF